MTAVPATRVGWCPGALRPMAARDGYIVRVKPRGATLSLAQAIGIAVSARTFGNGALELTSHANLQIRGASDATLPGLTAALDRLGLLDPDAGSEARRNVVSSPLAGVDAMVFDIRPVVAALEDRLAVDVGLAGLPAKFTFAVSDGGALPLGDAGADVAFDGGWSAQPHVPGADGMQDFMVRLAGGDSTVAFCPVQSVPDVAAKLAGWFIRARGADSDLRRMRHAVARRSAAAILAAVGLRPETSPGCSASRHPSRPGSPRPPMPSDGIRRDTEARDGGVGHFSLRSGAGGRDEPGHDDGEAEPRHVLGVAAPFGRLDAAQLDALGRGAMEAGARELRLTPWRSILVLGLTNRAAGRLADASGAAGLIVDPGDPRLRVAACSGAPGCHRGTTPVLEHAARWAAHLGGLRSDDRVLLHVSGCAKGCAHAGRASMTLVAEDGRYRLVSDAIPGRSGLDADAVSRLLEAACGGAT